MLNYTYHTLVAGYYDFTLAVRVTVLRPVRPTIVRTSVLPHFVSDNLNIYKRISFKFCISICIFNVSLWIVNGQMSIIYLRVKALVNEQKHGYWPLVP